MNDESKSEWEKKLEKKLIHQQTHSMCVCMCFSIQWSELESSVSISLCMLFCNLVVVVRLPLITGAKYEIVPILFYISFGCVKISLFSHRTSAFGEWYGG